MEESKCYIFVVLIIYALKPRFLFEENGRPRQFGVSFNRETMEKQTLLSLGNLTILLALLIFLGFRI